MQRSSGVQESTLGEPPWALYTCRICWLWLLILLHLLLSSCHCGFFAPALLHNDIISPLSPPMSSQSPCSINDIILGYWLHHEVIGVTSLLVPSHLGPVTFNIIMFLMLEVMYLSLKGRWRLLYLVATYLCARRDVTHSSSTRSHWSISNKTCHSSSVWASGSTSTAWVISTKTWTNSAQSVMRCSRRSMQSSK